MLEVMSDLDDARHDLFLRLFTAAEPFLRAFVRSLVPTVTDADDVMQEVAVVLWRRFGEYGEKENVRRWAFGVAKYKVLSWQRDRGRDRHLFNDAITSNLADRAQTLTDRLAAQRQALAACLDKLPPDQRRIVDAAYAPGAMMKEISRAMGWTPMALYKRLHRIRLLLLECTRRMLEGGAA
jgi:RNA polymerase sigma-70 factor (ECF subfamily)